MKLNALIAACRNAGLNPTGHTDSDVEISQVCSDSRQVKPGTLFIAVNGLDADGHDFIEAALSNGAAAVIAQTPPVKDDRITTVDDSRLAQAILADCFFDHPSKDMTLIGVTGTNGKTTVTWLLESILNVCGFQTGVIGTVNIRFNGQIIDNPYTTPDAIYLQRMLARMKKAGVTHVIMEVSSHGLELNRVDGCRFDAGIFTNLTQDHLDFHPDMNAYFEAKKRLFTEFLAPSASPEGFAVLNIDNGHGLALTETVQCTAVTVSRKKTAEVCATQIDQDINGTRTTIMLDNQPVTIESGLTGDFNLENILCAVGAAKGLKLPPDKICQGLSECRIIPGRLEKIVDENQRHLFVDYAHTPDALESVLKTLAPYAKKRIITVFGCGGDRDRAKRPLMGQAACKNSDIAIVTSDNPRTEDPDTIIEDILAGLVDHTCLDASKISSAPMEKGYCVEKDRKKAIQLAMEISKPDDVILVAGKGHEDYQLTRDGKIHFDDREELAKASALLKERFKPAPWTIDDLSDALGVSPVMARLESSTAFAGISTDSRTIGPDEIFVALKGENFDAQAFVPDLVEGGIRAIIVRDNFLRDLPSDAAKKIETADIVVFETVNTLEALGRLANFQRRRTHVKVLALTGSSGKTTTRKITQNIFSLRYHTLATQGNLNNEIGLPLTLLNLSHAHEWAVVEMGMNHRGEIARLSAIAQPDIAMVINTGSVHLEGLQSVENVARAKAEIFTGVQDGGTAILNADDPRFHILEYGALKNNRIEKMLLFGENDGTDLNAIDVRQDTKETCFTATCSGKRFDIRIPSPARFMVSNCLAAITAAKAAGIDIKCVQKAIAAFTPEKGRLNIRKIGKGMHLIDDTYNANPESMARGLETLVAMAGQNPSFAVLGDMLELGEETEQLHWEIGKKAATLGIAKLFVYGPLSENIRAGALENGFSEKNVYAADKSGIADMLAGMTGENIWILVKGSRGMAMETVIRELENKLAVEQL